MRLRRLQIASVLLTFLPGAAEAVQSAPLRGPYLVADAHTGQVLEHFDAVRPWFPASTTKLMTLYVALRAIAAGQVNLGTPVVYSRVAAAQPASKMGFKPGTALTLDNALKIMMVKSANDIAVAVAETIGGSVAGFAERMNAEAQRLGMSRSHFVNPHGLPDPGQVTTARDMALVGRALLLEFPQYREFLNIHAIEIGGKVLKNFNPLLERYPGANGMKTGFICASGFNLVASARRGEREVIAVVFGAYGDAERAEHAAELLEEAFQTPSPAPDTAPTLADVVSGRGYTEPLDMRPFVCSPGRAETAADAPTPETRGLAVASASAVSDAPTSPLGPPIYLGPPVPVSVIVPPKAPRPGQPGFVARTPRPRPALAGDGKPLPSLDAFAPAPHSAAESGAALAIDAAAGAGRPLKQ